MPDFQQPTQKPQPSGDIDFNDAIEQLRIKKGIPKPLVDRLISQESDGNESAVSPKGAQGSFQVMPGTFDQYNRKVGGTLDPNNPLHRAYVGLSLLKDNYDQFKPYAKNDQHNWGMAVAGYHAGPNNVMRDLRRGGVGIPNTNDGLINTRDYVYNIMRGAGDLSSQQPEFSAVDATEQEPKAPKTPQVTSTVREADTGTELPSGPTQQPKPIAPVQSNNSAMSRRMEASPQIPTEIDQAHSALAYLPPDQQKLYGPAIMRAKQLQDQEMA